MRRKIPLLLTALAVSLTFSCASDAPDETPDVMTSIDITDESHDHGDSDPDILHWSGAFGDVNTLDEEYAVSDYVILCEVTGAGNSFMAGKKGEDPDEDYIIEHWEGIRTPYTVRVIKCFKGDPEEGGELTVCGLWGEMKGLTLVAGDLPTLEVGKVYMMPVRVSDPDEMLPYFPTLAEIPDYDTSKTPGENGGAVLVPAMKNYEYTYKGYRTLSDILENYPRKQSV